MGYKVDKDNVQESYDPVPAGEYQCKIERVEEKVSSNGNEMMSFMCDIIGPSQAGRKMFFCIVYTTTFADAMFGKLCASCGIDLAEEMTPELFIGKVCTLETDGEDGSFPKIRVRTKPKAEVAPTPVTEKEDEIPF